MWQPWMRVESTRGTLDTAAELCRKLRDHDDATCAVTLRVQALWWREFGRGACVLVGEGARGRAQGFVLEQFEAVLLLHARPLPPADLGRPGSAARCDGREQCVAAAKAKGCALYSYGVSPPIEGATALSDVFQRKMGVFGGPPTNTVS